MIDQPNIVYLLDRDLWQVEETWILCFRLTNDCVQVDVKYENFG